MSPGKTPRSSQKTARSLAKTSVPFKNGPTLGYKKNMGASTSKKVVSYHVKKVTGFRKLFHSELDSKIAEISLNVFKSKKGFSSFQELNKTIIDAVRLSGVKNANFADKNTVLKVIRILKINGFLV